MTIKDIAKLAQVSPSTVSKIINGKDENISEKTKALVRQLIERYQYVPYVSVKDKFHSNLLALLLREGQQGEERLARGARDEAAKSGYCLVYAAAPGAAEGVQRAVNQLMQANVEGVAVSADIPAEFVDWEGLGGTRRVLLGGEGAAGSCFVSVDPADAGAQLAARLLSQNHTNIGVLVSSQDSRLAQEMVRGVSGALDRAGAAFDPNCVEACDGDERQIRAAVSHVVHRNVTAIVCESERIAARAHRALLSMGFKVPQDLSLASLGLRDPADLTGISLVRAVLPFEEAGAEAVRRLIAMIRGEKAAGRSVRLRAALTPGNSVGWCTTGDIYRPNLIVVGSLHTDILVRVPQIPQRGDTLIASSVVSIPGGKGANQAVGAAKLGANTTLIGRIGGDQDGKDLYSALKRYGVNVDGIVFDDVCSTGRGFINVGPEGENTIVIHNGANERLSVADIDGRRELFDNCEACMLGMEIPVEVFEHVIRLCAERKIRVVLKPSDPESLSDRVLAYIDYLIPHEKELLRLVPGGGTIEERAAVLLEKGVRHVIVTLDERGSCLCSAGETKWFPVAHFRAVDTTGAAAAFISAFTVYLAQGNSVEKAIGYATYAAGICITRENVQSALADRADLEAYTQQIEQWTDVPREAVMGETEATAAAAVR